MATLQKLGDEAVCPINLSQFGIGRAPDNEFVVDDLAVSAYHAIISVQESNEQGKEKYILKDLNSTNKTFVNNHEVSNHTLKNGDIIRVGETRLKFSRDNKGAPRDDFQKTQKLNKKRISSFLYTK